MTARSTRIVLVDDHVLVRSGMKALLDAQPDLEVTGEAGDGAEGVELALERRPDVVLMDLRMPGSTGSRRRAGSSPPAHGRGSSCVTSHDDDTLVLHALRAGASGFFLKDAAADRLCEAVRAVAAGDTLLAPPIARRLVESQLGEGGARIELQTALRHADRARARHRPPARPRTVECRAGARDRAQRGDGQDPRHPAAVQARRAQPRPGRRTRLRERLRPPRPYGGAGAVNRSPERPESDFRWTRAHGTRPYGRLRMHRFSSF